MNKEFTSVGKNIEVRIGEFRITNIACVDVSKDGAKVITKPVKYGLGIEKRCKKTNPDEEDKFYVIGFVKWDAKNEDVMYEDVGMRTFEELNAHLFADFKELVLIASKLVGMAYCYDVRMANAYEDDYDEN